MHSVPLENVASWMKRGEFKLANIVDTLCPHCSRLIALSIQWAGSNATPLMWGTAACPACRKLALVIQIERRDEDGHLFGHDLYIDPSPKTRWPKKEILEDTGISETIKRNYASALNVLNAREWNAAVVLCRRLLEAMVASILPASSRSENLAKRLATLPKHRDLQKPIIDLSHAIRKAGNLGAHFDESREPDEETAVILADLSEYLMTYLFVIPRQIASVQYRIDGAGGANDTDRTNG